MIFRVFSKTLFLVVVGFFLFGLLRPHDVAKSFGDPTSGWSITSHTPYSNSNHSSVIVNNNIFMINGSIHTGQSRSTILYAPIDQDGFISTWVQSEISTPDALIYHATVSKENNIYVLGGKSEPYGIGNSVDFVWLGSFDGSSLSDWTELKTLPKRLAKGEAVVVGERIYFVGGATWTNNGEPVPSSSVYFTNINPDGTIGDWISTTELPVPLSGHGLIETNGRITTVGGSTDPSETPIDKTYSASVNSDGTLGNWVEGPSMPLPLRDGSTVKVGNYVVQIGGIEATYSNKVFYSEIGADGNLGPWNISADFPIFICCSSASVLNDRIYVVGGYDDTHMVSSNSVYVSNLPLSTPSPFPTPTEIPIPTPTSVPIPTPTVTPNRNPIVLIPGMLASWNYDALIHNEVTSNENWTWVPVVGKSFYTGIIQTLQDAGYNLGNDMFVYHYDWRKNIGVNAENFEKYVNDKILASHTDTGKVILIGHSMGGLIARDYVQRTKGGKTDKLITVGSPHRGSAKSYLIWEGADLGVFPTAVSLGMRVFLEANKKKFGSEVETIQGMVPSGLDLLPIDNFLRKKNGSEIPISKMYWQNYYLKNLEIGLPDILSRFWTISGTGLDTLETMTVVEADWYDKLTKKWKDGKPVEYLDADGDETVLTSSSGIGQTDHVLKIPVNGHSSEMNDSTVQRAILDTLGIHINTNSVGDFSGNKFLVATVASPVDFQIRDPGGEVILPKDNLIVIPNPDNGTYVMEMKGTNQGEYTVFFGRINGVDSAWEDKSGHIEPDQKLSWNFYVDLSSNTLGANPLERALARIKNLQDQIDQSQLPKLKSKILKNHLNLLRIGILSLKTCNRGSKDKYQLCVQILHKGIDETIGVWQLNYWKDVSGDLRDKLSEQLRMIKYDILQDYQDRY